MNHYIDITLISNAEIRTIVLMNEVYTRFHKALFDLRYTCIGVSFPKYEITLGNILRIHGDKSSLNDLQGLNWIGGMNGYCNVSEIAPVPSDVKYRTVSRVQTTMSNSKFNRLLKRGSITEEEAKNYRTKMFTKGLDNPYLDLISGSNGHKHRRYIEFGELVDKPVSGQFDQFGLSKTATIPWFD